MTPTLALQLCSVFSVTSLLAFGGGNAADPQFRKMTVQVYHCSTPQQQPAQMTPPLRQANGVRSGPISITRSAGSSAMIHRVSRS